MTRLEWKEVLTNSVTYWACPRGLGMSRRIISSLEGSGRVRKERGGRGGGREEERTSVGSYLTTSKSQEDTRREGTMIRMILRPSSLSLGDMTVSAARTGRYEVGVGGKNSGSDEGLFIFIAGAWALATSETKKVGGLRMA